MLFHRHTLFLLLGLAFLPAAAGAQPVSIQIDASKPLGPVKPIWSFFGYDEPNYT